MTRFAALLFAAALLLSGWAPLPAASAEEPPAPAPAQAELETPAELKARIDSGFYGKKADEPLLKLARMLARGGDLKGAAEAAVRVADWHPSSARNAEALFMLASIRYAGGAFAEARSLLARVEDSPSASEQTKRNARSVAADIDEMGRGPSPAASIGALLPLKGGYAAFGEGALKGVLLAAGAFDGSTGPVEVLLADPGSDPRAAGAAVDGMAAAPEVVGVVGPLIGAISVEAALHAQDGGLPIVLLTQREGVTSAGRYVFRIALRPADQAFAVAEHAVKTLGLKKLAILYPQNGYGTELAAAFKESAGKLGATVLKETAYQQGTRDFSREVRLFFEVVGKERREGRRYVTEYENKFKPEAVYIPDYHESVAMLLPYFEYYGIKDVKLLGSNGWNSQRLVENLGGAVDGAVLADGFFSSSKRQGSSRFAAAFQRAYGSAPGVIEAQAFDAAGSILKASRTSDGARASREETAANLRTRSDYEGAAGQLRFDEKGEAVKKIFLLGVKGGEITEMPDAAAGDDAGRRR